MKNKVYSSKSKFNNIKVEFKGGLNYMGISSYYFNMTIEASWRQCQQCNLCVNRFLGLTSTKQGVNAQGHNERHPTRAQTRDPLVRNSTP